MRFVSVLVIVISAAAYIVRADNPAVEIVKVPETVETRIFDPANPPADMPPFTPPETAECDSNFLSDAQVGGQAKQTGPTTAKLIINKITVTIQLNITIWLPTNKFQKLIDHENGHRTISENYYKNADLIARRIAETYIGKEVQINGTDLRKSLSAALSQAATDITNEYNKEIPVETTQLRYDAINQHGVNDVPVQDAIDQAMKETFPAQPTTEPSTPANP